MGLQHYTQDMSEITLKYHKKVCFAQSIHPTLICRGTDARTDGRTENIYSKFRDKLLLLGEHGFFYLKFVKTDTKHYFNVSEIQYGRFVDTIYFFSKSFACCEVCNSSTSAPTPQHDLLAFHSLLIPQHAATAHTPLLGQTSTSPGPRLRPTRPNYLTLKTFSTQSLPMQTTIFNTMNAANLDVCTSPPPPPHLSSTVMRSSAKSTKKTWSLSFSPLTPGHGLVQCQCSRHSSQPPTIPAKNPGAPRTPTINTTDPMPTSCTSMPPNHHAHSGSSYQPTSNGNNLPRQQAGLSLATPTLPPCQVYILFSPPSDSAFLRHTAHYYAMLPIRSNFIP